MLNTTTMQNVAWAITSDQTDSSMPRIVVKALLSAIPVTIPGSAMGSRISSETASPPEEPVALQGEGREGAEHQRDRRRRQRRR